MNRIRTLIAAAATGILVGGTLAVPPALAEPPKPSGPLKAQQVPLGDDGHEVRAVARKAADVPDLTLPAPQWPAAGSSLPVAKPKGARSAAADAAPAAVVLDRAKLPERYRAGVVARVSGPAALTVDYSKFQYAYGGGWSSRLRLWSLPECALTTPDKAGCSATPLPSTNDEAQKAVTATTTAASVVALAAAPAGDSGDFGATPLASSSTWSSGGSTGDFSWSYPVKMPTALGGPEPQISLDYSSSSVDGRSSATNNQPSWIGEGFEYSPGFIERRYVPCDEDESGSPNNPEYTGDLCWRSQNATLSLGGSSSELVYEEGKGWHARSEDGSKIERLTGATNGDNDGEYWKVTTTDGTQYFFGLNKLTGQSSDTNSAWTVPVYGNHAGEPGHADKFADSDLAQAWRWNVDYAIDTHGNTISFWYDKETNQYGAEADQSKNTSYVRGGSLARIDYGTWDRGASDRSVTAQAQVVFDRADRCLSDCTTHDGSHWPDTPWDQECKSTATECDSMVPTFWSTKRLAKITTRVWDTTKSPAAWQNVDSYTFTHSFPSPGDGQKGGLWLKEIVHSGLAGGTVTLPPVTFEPVALPNRVLTKTNTTNNWQRLSSIITETGSQIQVTYSLPDCTSGDLPSSPQNNTRLCYPVVDADPYDPDGADITEWWHKYVVTKVIQTDTQLADGHQAPNVVTEYTYQGTPAWHYSDDDGLTKPKRKTWDQFRGYATVLTKVGNEAKTLTKTTYLRGMHGDKAAPSGGTRTVTVDASLGSETVYDEDQFAGMARETVVYNGSEDKPVSKTVTVPWRSDPTASRTINGDTVTARYVATKATYKATALGVDGARGWRTTSTATTYDDYGLPVTVQDNGDTAKSGDEKCTTTSYNRNTAKNLLTTVKQVTVKALPCATAPASADQMLSDSVSYYDGATSSSTAPVHGDLTRADSLKNWTASGGTEWQTTAKTTFDAYGRQVTTTDKRGNTVTTVLTPAAGLPTSRADTNQLGWTTTTNLNLALQLPEKVTDPNGRVSEAAYDALGRTIATWDIGWTRTGHESQPSSRFTYYYDTARTSYPYVKTEALNSGGTTDIKYDIYDALLRPRQTQTEAVGGGRVVTDTIHDSHGRVEMTYGAHAEKGDPAGTLYWTPEWSVPSQNLNYYDQADRVTATAYRAGDGVTNIVERWRTSTTYEGDRTTVVPPKGGTSTTTVVDAQGRTTEAWQYTTPGASSGAHLTTTYAYDARDKLSSVKDSSGDQWTFKYDVLGRQIESRDPDKGTTTSTYTAYDDVESTTDARGKKLWFTYDGLGRMTATYDTSASDANRRVTWTYDKLYTGVPLKGQMTESVRYDNGNQFKWQARGFTQRYDVSGEQYVVPASETGLAGSYVYGYTYSEYTGAPVAMTYPAAGGLVTETVTTKYDGTSGLPTGLDTNLSTVGSYVALQDYSAFGEPTVTTLKTAGGVYTQQSVAYEHDTRRVNQVKVKPESSTGTVSDRVYNWENNGNLNSISDTPEVGTADNQCFGYDALLRLTSAWTPKAGVNCATAPSVANLGGAAPYWTDWTIDTLGNRTKQVEHFSTGDKTTSYTVPTPGAGVVRPHAVTATSTIAPGQTTPTTAAYTYDASGNTLTRPGQTLTWDSEGKQATIAENGTVTTSNVYDPEGGRLVHRDKTGTTLYLPGQEVKVPAGGSATATRNYSFGNSQVATRTPAAQSLSWLFSDHQGTQAITVNASTQKVTIRRQRPYGESRGDAVQWPTAKGFVGGDVDASGLTNVGARVYDPLLGRFLSVDPVQDLMDPQQWNGYSYSNNSPITFSDPTGETMGSAGCSGGEVGGPGACSGHEDPGVAGPPPGNEGGYKSKTVTYSNGTEYESNYGGSGGDRINKVVIKIQSPAVVNAAEMAAALDAYKGDHPVAADAPVALDYQDDATNTLNGIYLAWANSYLQLRGEEEQTLSWWKMVMTFHQWTGLLSLGGDGTMHTLGPMSVGRARKNIAGAVGGCGRNSFSPETLVLMADGTTKKIGDIEVGDEVLATDPETGKTEAREVTVKHVNDDLALTDLTVRTSDGKRIVVRTTPEHLFWDEAVDAWVNAGQLTSESRLLSTDGSLFPVAGIRSYVGTRWMYNLTVADIHTYYVLAGNTPVLVHNDGGGLQDNIRLYGDYTARMDQFNVRGQASFEIHVYHRGTEVGLYGSNGFFNKHRKLAADVDVPSQVHNRLKGIAVDQMRKIGQLPPKASVKGDSWKRPMIGSTGGGC
ncbi:polymorphic toxin-type HINT domain-containing protein [Actinoplanes sp. RD1]|uniref:polymorphic toxin-type HINT domain-containing protein n=1 Tax=Actinoplanes sp. RD1 TaxID=3064538 RepID=UPI002740994F|nr:polymorphic toxin-type HINT domain-containing protein [Actinoplanes sp. RD1]